MPPAVIPRKILSLPSTQVPRPGEAVSTPVARRQEERATRNEALASSAGQESESQPASLPLVIEPGKPLEHDPGKHALGLRPDRCVAVFPRANARLCENIIPDQKSRTRWRLNLIPSRPSAPPNSLSQLTGDQTCRKRIPYEIGRIAISRDRTIVAPEGDKCISTSWRPHGVTSCLLPPDSSSIDRAAATTHSYNRVHPARSKGCLPTFGDPQ